MSSFDTPKVGAVAIHRWFARGEGWAYHPSYESHKQELLAALQEELGSRRELEKSGGRRPFTHRAMGGVLCGEQEKDPECPDERVGDRYPTILRAVFLLDPPDEERRAVVMQNSAAIVVERPGPDNRLEIHVKGQADSEGTRPMRWVQISLVAVCFLAIVGGLLLWSQKISKRTQEKPNDDSPRATTERIVELLQKWKVKGLEDIDNKDPARRWKVAQLLFHVLSQEDVKDKVQGKHPDSLFVQRLPLQGARPRTDEELRRELDTLLAGLSPKSVTQPGNKNLENRDRALTDALDDLEKQMDYVRWWASDGHKLNYALHEKSDPAVASFVSRFIIDKPVDRANRSWQKPAAELMVDALRNSWRVEAVTAEDADTRPWLVFHCFFQLLSQQHVQAEDLKDDSWHVEFVKRLPTRSLSQDGRFASEQDLIDKLRELANRLRAEKSDTTSTLLTNIVKSMDYEEWKKRAETSIFREAEKGPPDVERFVDRFRPKK